MSGSPVIQVGKLVDPETRVLVNDPTRGYGCFIENIVFIGYNEAVNRFEFNNRSKFMPTISEKITALRKNANLTQEALGAKLGITGQLNRDSVLTSDALWIEDDGFTCDIQPDKRVGIGYASQEDQDRLWRFKMQ